MLLAAVTALPASSLQAPAGAETLYYGVEWRLVRAGTAKLSWSPATAGSSPQINLELRSAGLVNALYRVSDAYAATLAGGFCTSSVLLHAEEGRRRRETRITFDAAHARASYLERDLLKNAVVNQKEIDIAPCTHDVIAGLYRLRATPLAVGRSMEFPISDGKKFVKARVEAQAREQVKTPAGNYQTVRYEVFLFNDILYKRTGRLFVWLTDDDLRVPVQIRVRLQFHVGTITLQLEKQERL